MARVSICTMAVEIHGNYYEFGFRRIAPDPDDSIRWIGLARFTSVSMELALRAVNLGSTGTVANVGAQKYSRADVFFARIDLFSNTDEKVEHRQPPMSFSIQIALGLREANLGSTGTVWISAHRKISRADVFVFAHRPSLEH